jgi:hypothetical protein
MEQALGTAAGPAGAAAALCDDTAFNVPPLMVDFSVEVAASARK